MKLLHDFRRRQMFRLIGLYIVGAWLIIQVADIVFPAWGIPDTALRYLFIAAALGFPVALVFGWIFDIRSDGIFRTKKAGPDETVETKLQRPDYAILAALLAVSIAIVMGSADKIQEEIESAPAEMERRENSIAVLPFDNLDTNPETGYFSDGVTEEILTRLSTPGVLHVIGRTSSFAFRNAAEGPARISELLGVRYLLHGSVRRQDDHVRVTARLIDEGGYQVWTQSFDRELKDIFVVQSEIASSVSGQIIDEIVPIEDRSAGSTTTNMEAYDAYLVGKALFNTRTPGWEGKATDALRRAIELDPDFAPPYAILAVASHFIHGEFDLDEAWALAKRAMELAPDLAEAHLAFGSLYRDEGEVARAIESYRHALELDPALSLVHAWLANILRREGLMEEAEAVQRRGLEVDPLNPVLMVNVAFGHLQHAGLDRAEQLFLRAAQVPEPAQWVYSWLQFFYWRTGQIDEVIYWLKQEVRALEDFIGEYGAENVAPGIDEFSEAYLELGMFDEASDWHEFSRSVHADSYNDLVFRAYFLRAQGTQTELRSHLSAYADTPELADRELSIFEKAELGILHITANQFATGIDWLKPEINLEIFDEFSTYKIPMARMMLYLAYALEQSGQPGEASDLLVRARTEIDAVDASDWHEMAETFEAMALCRGLLGDKDGALEALQRAIELGWIDYHWAINDPLWARAFEGYDLKQLLRDVKTKIDRQRAVVKAADAEHDFRAELEQLLQREIAVQ